MLAIKIILFILFWFVSYGFGFESHKSLESENREVAYKVMYADVVLFIIMIILLIYY